MKLTRGQKPSIWMAPVEFSQLRAILETLTPRFCLEWGSGGSTLTLLESCPFIEEYVSVEHDRAWHERVRSLVSDARLKLFHVAPDEPLRVERPTRRQIEAWDQRAEFEPALLASYVALPRTIRRDYDFILVDGRARNFCVREGYALLRPGGVIVVHDAQREENQAVLRDFARPVFLTPWSQGQLWFVKKPRVASPPGRVGEAPRVAAGP